MKRIRRPKDVRARTRHGVGATVVIGAAGYSHGPDVPVLPWQGKVLGAGVGGATRLSRIGAFAKRIGCGDDIEIRDVVRHGGIGKESRTGDTSCNRRVRAAVGNRSLHI